jgi:hypothetical protein
VALNLQFSCPSSECWDYRCAPPLPTSIVLLEKSIRRHTSSKQVYRENMSKTTKGQNLIHSIIYTLVHFTQFPSKITSWKTICNITIRKLALILMFTFSQFCYILLCLYEFSSYTFYHVCPFVYLPT